MTFQTVFDNASSISINKRKKVAQTVSRDGVVRNVSLGGQVWEFEVTLPSGPSYQTYRPLIEKMEALDRVSTATVNLSRTNFQWFNKYQGNYLNITGTVVVSVSTGNIVTVVSGPNLGTGFKFKTGDYIQLGTGGKVYTVVDDVPAASNTITLHRPVRESTGTYTLVIGHNVNWTVQCVQFPNWSLQERNQVSWSGPFVFAEVI